MGKNTINTPIIILLLIPYPNHKIRIGANANTGIDWLASNIGNIHLLNLEENDIIIAKILPIIIPINKDAKISMIVI